MHQIKIDCVVVVLLDEDECCAGTFCHVQSNCTKTFANFTCACNDGYTGNGTYCEGIFTIYPLMIVSSFLYF